MSTEDPTASEQDLNTQVNFIVALNQVNIRFKYQTGPAQAMHSQICILIDKINNFILTNKC